MIKRILPQTEYSKNVLKLITGTAIAQAIPIAISPILTRIYSPNDFGVFALYLSISSVISVVASGRYEFAINLPKKDEDGIQILWLSCILSLLVCLISFLFILLFKNKIGIWLGNPSIKPWLYFIPLTIFISCLNQNFNYWQNRKKQYGVLSKGKVFQTVGTSSLNLTIGYLSSSVLGLIIGNIIGIAMSACYLIRYSFKSDSALLNKVDKVKMIALAKRYKNFPKFDALASLINISSNQITNIFFNIFFSPVISGYYYLTQKIFSMPITLIASSIQDVFRMEMIATHNNGGNTRKLYIKTFKTLVLMSILPTILIYFFSVDLFAFIFGSNWKQAGEFVQILTPVFFLRFISFPLSYMFYVMEKQSFNIIGQFVLLILIITSFVIGKSFNAVTTVKLLSLSFSTFYASYIIISFNFTSVGNK